MHSEPVEMFCLSVCMSSSLGRVDGVVFPNPEATFVKEV